MYLGEGRHIFDMIGSCLILLGNFFVLIKITKTAKCYQIDLEVSDSDFFITFLGGGGERRERRHFLRTVCFFIIINLVISVNFSLYFY